MKPGAVGTIILLIVASAAGVLGPFTAMSRQPGNSVFCVSDGGTPHNVILMVADGMGYEQLRLGTWIEVGKAANLIMATLDYSLGVTTYSADSATTDSAAAATAMATGHKTRNGRVSIGSTGQLLETIMEIAQGMNKSSGIVTTAEVQDATPAAFMTHVLSRSNYAEITRQIVEEAGVDVLLGGGLSSFSSQQIQTMQSSGYAFVVNRTGLLSVSSGKVLGLFANNNMPYEQNRDYTSTPSLVEMTGKAIDILSTDPDGFFLMVEGGLIDKAAHLNDRVNVALDTIAFDKAVNIALNYVQTNPRTMLIVAADHETGALSITSDTLSAEVPSFGNTEQYNRSLRISRTLNVTTSWMSTGHTSANVPLFLEGRLPGNWTDHSTIDNTDIFHGMYAHLLLDLPHEETSPIIQLKSPANNSLVKPFASIDLNVTDPGGVYVVLYHWDMIANDTLVPPYHLAARTSQVAHWLYVYASDVYDNWASAVFVFTTDGTPPLITLFTPGNGTMHYSGAIVGVNITDEHLTQVLYHWDSQSSNVTWVSPYETTLPVGDGVHVLHVYANDSAGNLAAVDCVFYTHDGAPIVTLEIPANGNVVRSGLTVRVSVLDQALDTVLYSWDNATNFAPWSPPYETPLPSGEANPVLYVWANNTLASSTQVSFSFIVDDLPPQIALFTPENGTIVRSDAGVAFNISDAHFSHAWFSWDGVVNESLGHPFAIALPGIDGWHRLFVAANDSAGNSAWSMLVWKVDNTAPEIVPQNDITMYRGELGRNVTWSAQELNPANYTVLLNGSSLATGRWNSSSEFFVILLNGFDVGVYNLTIKLEDLAGNRASSTVIVQVQENTSSTITTTTNTSSSDIAGVLTIQTVLVLGALAASLFVVAVLVTRFRRSSPISSG